MWDIVARTLWLALASTAIAMVIGLPLGVWLAGGRSRTRRAGLTLANAGLGLPPVVLGVFLALLFRPTNVLGFLHFDSTLQAVLIAQTLLALPIVVALTAVAVAALPGGLLDQARAFGASATARFVLALREARIGVFAAIIAGILSALAEIGAVVIVGGNHAGTNTVASTILIELDASDFAGATAQLIVLIVLVSIVGGLLTFVQQRAR